MMDYSEVIVVDLDNSKVTYPSHKNKNRTGFLQRRKQKFESPKLPEMPKGLESGLRTDLEKLHEDVFLDGIGNEAEMRMSFLKVMQVLLKDYDRYTSHLVDSIPVFNVVDCLETKPLEYKNFYYLFFNTQMFYYFLQE